MISDDEIRRCVVPGGITAAEGREIRYLLTEGRLPLDQATDLEHLVQDLVTKERALRKVEKEIAIAIALAVCWFLFLTMPFVL